MVLVGGLAACSDDSDADAANRRLCDARDRVGAALDAIGDAEGEGRSEELAAARDELFDAIAEMAHASSDVAEAEGDAGNNPAADLNERLAAIDDDADPGEIGAGMARAAGEFLADIKELIDEERC